jgi:hypothetical protein
MAKLVVKGATLGCSTDDAPSILMDTGTQRSVDARYSCPSRNLRRKPTRRSIPDPLHTTHFGCVAFVMLRNSDPNRDA